MVQSDSGIELGSSKFESGVCSRRGEYDDVSERLVPVPRIDNDTCVVVSDQPDITSRDVVVVILGIEGTFLLQQKVIANVHKDRLRRGSADLAVEHLAARVHEVRGCRRRRINGLYPPTQSIVAVGVGVCSRDDRRKLL